MLALGLRVDEGRRNGADQVAVQQALVGLFL